MTPALLLPIGAVITGIFMLVFPLAALVAVWAVVSLYRVIFPERAPSVQSRRRSVARPVTAREIVKQQRAHTSEPPGLPRPAGERVATTDFPARTPIEEVLWARRN